MTTLSLSLVTLGTITGFMKKHLGICGFMAMAAGVVVGNITVIEPLRYLIPVALFLMLYPSMLNVRPEGLAAVFTAPRLPVIALIMNFVVSPVMIFGISHLFRLYDTPAVLTGITLFGTMPCGGLIAAFTVILHGNVALTVLVSTLSYLLNLVLVPFWTKLIIGQVVPVSPLLMLKYLFMIIILPWVMADLTRRTVLRIKGEPGFLEIRRKLMILPSLGLMVLLFTVFVLNSRNLLADPSLILKIMLPAGSFLIALIIISRRLCRFLHLNQADSTAMVLSTTAKNNAGAMALALSAFGTDVGMVIAFTGPITQFPIMLTYLKFARSRMKRQV